jgi:hypothetical protein
MCLCYFHIVCAYLSENSFMFIIVQLTENNEKDEQEEDVDGGGGVEKNITFMVSRRESLLQK